MRPRPSKSLDLGLKFRGFLRSRLAFSSDFEGFRGRGWLKSSRIFWGYTSKNPQKSRQGWGHECWGFSRIPRETSKKWLILFIKTEVFRGSLKNRPIYKSEVFSRVALEASKFEAETSKGFFSWGVFEGYPRKTLPLEGFSRLNLKKPSIFEARPRVWFSRILTTLIPTPRTPISSQKIKIITNNRPEQISSISFLTMFKIFVMEQMDRAISS